MNTPSMRVYTSVQGERESVVGVDHSVGGRRSEGETGMTESHSRRERKIGRPRVPLLDDDADDVGRVERASRVRSTTKIGSHTFAALCRSPRGRLPCLGNSKSKGVDPRALGVVSMYMLFSGQMRT